MKVENIDRAMELGNILKITQKALNDINKILNSLAIKGILEDAKIYQDGIYNLNISQHPDGSGFKVPLNRYCGNKALLNVIKQELESQAAAFKKEIETL